MLRGPFLLLASTSLALSACVQTRQVADVEFEPPKGDYSLIVMRPDVSVGLLTAGGLVEPRADWTERARANLLKALAAQQSDRGGRTRILESRSGIAGVRAEQVAELERLHAAVGASIAIHKYLG